MEILFPYGGLLGLFLLYMVERTCIPFPPPCCLVILRCFTVIFMTYVRVSSQAGEQGKTVLFMWPHRLLCCSVEEHMVKLFSDSSLICALKPFIIVVNQSSTWPLINCLGTSCLENTILESMLTLGVVLVRHGVDRCEFGLASEPQRDFGVW